MSIFTKLTRKKLIDRSESSELNRVLSTLDLTMLGIGSTLGIGIYVLSGTVAKKESGPAVVVSFFVAAVASVLAGISYAEFGARVPKAGSAYVYSYVCVGELIAFIVGWNLIMEYVIGVASVSKGYSENIDKLLNNAMSDFFRQYFPIGNYEFVSEYFDWFAFSITVLLAFVLAFGVKESSFLNNIFTGLNLGVVIFVVIVGSFYANTNNWFLDKNEILNNYPNVSAEAVGDGGFMPFGFHGVMKSAATCFFGYVGFDAIASTGEEAINPQKSIPMAIIFSLLFIFLAYFGISTVITMMVPYFLQDENAPLPNAMVAVGADFGRWIVSIGAIFGLSTSLLGSMFPMPRIIYAMASDGVLPHFLSRIHPHYQTPIIATLLAGTFAGLMAAIFNLKDLISMMSVGTLTAYTLVDVCILCLRYRKDIDGADDVADLEIEKQYTLHPYWKRWLNLTNVTVPTEASAMYANIVIAVYCCISLLFCWVAIQCEDLLTQLHFPSIIAIILLGSCLIFILVSLSLQPATRVKLSFKVPLVPHLPGISILINTYLILKLSWQTWVRFSVWMVIGFIIYGICLYRGTTDKIYNSSVEKYLKKRADGSVNSLENQNFDKFQLPELADNTNTDENEKPTESPSSFTSFGHGDNYLKN